MKYLKNYHILFLLPFLFAASCGDEDKMEVPEEETSVYESCCGAEPVEYTQGDAYIYTRWRRVLVWSLLFAIIHASR